MGCPARAASLGENGKASLKSGFWLARPAFLSSGAGLGGENCRWRVRKTGKLHLGKTTSPQKPRSWGRGAGCTPVFRVENAKAKLWPGRLIGDPRFWGRGAGWGLSRTAFSIAPEAYPRFWPKNAKAN
jgi:hypothetical protein